MYLDSKDIVNIFGFSRTMLAKYESDGRFPKHNKMVRIEEGTADKKVWLESDVENYVNKILELNKRGLENQEIAEQMNTTKKVVRAAIRTKFKDEKLVRVSTSFDFFLNISSKLGVN